MDDVIISILNGNIFHLFFSYIHTVDTNDLFVPIDGSIAVPIAPEF